MIVRPIGSRLLLMTQPDHAQLAARIMEHCVPLAAHPRSGAILRAIAEHDNGWAEEDAAPCVDSAAGTIFDFVSAPLSVRQAVWPRSVARMTHEPWAAALVAQHAVTVYDRYRGQAGWDPFFIHMKATRDALLSRSGMSFDELRADYTYVRVADLISLTFCNAWTDEQRFDDWTIQLTGTSVRVTPSAFGGKLIPIEISAMDISNQPFRSNDELRAALSGARTVTLHGEVGD